MKKARFFLACLMLAFLASSCSLTEDGIAPKQAKNYDGTIGSDDTTLPPPPPPSQVNN